jgi:hypothetical protein
MRQKPVLFLGEAAIKNGKGQNRFSRVRAKIDDDSVGYPNATHGMNFDSKIKNWMRETSSALSDPG